MHIDDLKHVFAELGMDAHCDGTVLHYQDICPPCRRRLLALNQGRTMAAVKMQWVGTESLVHQADEKLETEWTYRRVGDPAKETSSPSFARSSLH
jgi:hypothetical protein